MKYANSGKRSRAWWLQAVKWFGDNGAKGIMRGGEVPTYQVKDALEDLVDEGFVSIIGKVGSGYRPKYHLTELGSRYLDRNADELEEKPEPVEPITPPEPEVPAKDIVYTKRIINGHGQYCADGKLINRDQVPALTRARLDSETPDPIRTQSTGAVNPGVHHIVPVVPRRTDLPPEPVPTIVKDGGPNQRPAADRQQPKPEVVQPTNNKIQSEGRKLYKPEALQVTKQQFNDLYMEALTAILIKRYADQVKASEVVDFINSNWDGMIKEAENAKD